MPNAECQMPNLEEHLWEMRTFDIERNNLRFE
jgi:hypothetical protein